MKAPSKVAVLTNQMRTFGKMETILYYADLGKKAGERLNVALADKNALTAAKEARDVHAAIDAIYAIIALDSKPEENSKK